MGYNSSGQLSTITDPAGRTYTLAWSGGHIASVTDSAGREVSYGYDSSGDLTDVYGVGTTRTPSLQNNDHTQYTYTTTHLLTSVRQPKYYGDTTTSPSPVMSMTYDSSERVLTQTDQVGRTTTFTYGPSTRPSLSTGQTLVTDPAGNQVLDTYANGLLSSRTTGYGSSTPSTTGYTYDPVSLGVTSITDPKGNKETFSYNALGEKTSSSNQLGQTTSYTYDALGDLTSATDPLGVKTSIGYDQAGHIATASGTNSGSLVYGLPTSQTVQQMDQSADIVDSNPATLPSRTVNYYYDTAAHPADQTRVVDADGYTTTSTYDADGDLTSVTDPMGDKAEYGYNTGTGQRTSAVSADGVAAGTGVGCTPPAQGCTTYGYDAFGDLTTTTDADGHKVTAVFDTNGNKISSTDGDNRTTSYAYDPANEQTTVTQPNSTVTRTDYTLDGSVADTVDGTGAETSYTYDSQNRKSSTTDPDKRRTSYGYDVDSNLTTVTNPAGQTTTYSYDKADQSTGVSYSDGKTPSITLTYDADGQRTSMTDGTGTTTWSYDAFGDPVSETNGAGSTVGYSYDNDGNPTSIVYPGGTAQTVTQTFDKADRLSSVTDWNSAKTTFGYDADGNLSSTVYPDGDTVAAGYDNADNQMSVTLSGAASASLTYTRDDAGQVSGVTPVSLPGGAQTDTYTTDEQLASSTTGSTTTAYAYNAAGEPTTAGGSAQAFDAAGQLCWTLPGTATSSSPCGTKPTGATSYSYDTQGDRTAATPATGTASSYSYNEADQLTGYTGAGGTAGYTYNGQGLRVAKTVGAVTTGFTWSIGSVPAVRRRHQLPLRP
jgi:YD repeat-containing protein